MKISKGVVGWWCFCSKIVQEVGDLEYYSAGVGGCGIRYSFQHIRVWFLRWNEEWVENWENLFKEKHTQTHLELCLL